MSTDYFNTLPSGYIEYIDKIMKNLVVGSHKAPEWSDDWDIRLDSLDGTPIFSINGDSTYPIYRINYNPRSFIIQYGSHGWWRGTTRIHRSSLW